MSIQLTDNAAQRVKHFLEKESGLALSVLVSEKPVVPVGHMKSAIASELGNDDQVFRRQGCQDRIVDNESLPYLQGSTN